MKREFKPEALPLGDPARERPGIPKSRATCFMACVALALAVARTGLAQTVLFADDFNRPDSIDLDASTIGMSGILAPLTYLETWQTGAPGNDSTLQINNSTLLKANTGGMGMGGLNHNFIDSSILADGGFRVSLDLTAVGSASDDLPDRYGGFGVGLTLAEINAFQDENDTDLGPRGTIAGVTHSGVADFYVGLSIENKVQVFTGGSLVGEFPVTPSGARTISADFTLADFDAGSIVNYTVSFEGSPVTAGSFTWSNTGQNYVGFSMRSSSVSVDNLAIESVYVDHSADLQNLEVEPGTLVPGFQSNVLSYSVTLPYTNSSVVLTPTAVNPSADIQIIVAGATNMVASGAPSTPVSLEVGGNPLVLRVISTTASQDYSIDITRVPANPVNVVLILADDMGFSDWGCYGGEIQTPNIDQLAAEGLRFRQFYNASRCSPTRCSILTGLYPHQAAVDPTQALPNLGTDNNVTIAELLQSNGYRTYMAGKWHLGNGGRLPEARGFEQVWRFGDGNWHSADNWDSSLYTLVSQDGEVTNRTYPGGTFYQPDALGDYALDFIDHHESKGDGRPFFLYMAFGSAHFPLQAPKTLVNQYTPVYSAGWDTIRTNRYNQMQGMGVIDPTYLLSPRGGTAPHQTEPIEVIPAWSALASDRQADLARRMAIYAAMGQKLDENVGRVVQRLQSYGELDNTLIFVLSDNGGNHEGGRFGRTGGTINATPLTGAALDDMGQAGQPEILLGGGWAKASDTPFRLFKHHTHEGGIRTPLVVHWPDGITRTNAWEDQPGHLMDIMATIVDVTGVTYPTQYLGHAVLPLEGVSLRPAFEGQPPVKRTIAFEHESNRGLIDGDWKLVTKNFTLYDGSSPANEVELYNISVDPVELTNVAGLNPVRLFAMASSWNSWALRVGLPTSRLINIGAIQPPTTPGTNTNDLFIDTFDRPSNTDADASAAGMWGSRVPPLGASATYHEHFEGSGSASSIQIVSSNLQMAVGAGMSENGLMHNFIGQDILDAGGFTVELNVLGITSTGGDEVNRFAGFGVGLSQAEAGSGWDVYTTPDPGEVAFRGAEGGNTGVADFFVELDQNSNVKVWNNGSLLDTVPVGQNFGVLTASFELDGFAASDTVTVNVFFNGQPVDINVADTNSVSRTFEWDADDSNYIGLSGRASSEVAMDNLAVRRLPLSSGLVINYAMEHGLSGADTDAEADPEGDGLINYGEWAFGGDPSVPDALVAGMKGIWVGAGEDFQFEFQRLIHHASLGVQYRTFISEDLGTWTETAPILITSAQNEDHPDYEIVRWQLTPAAVAGKTQVFVRVQAESAG